MDFRQLGEDLFRYHQKYESLLADQNEQLRDFTRNFHRRWCCWGVGRRCRLYSILADLDVLIDEAEDLLTRAAADTTIEPRLYVKYYDHMREELQMLRASRRDIEKSIKQSHWFYWGNTYDAKKRQ